LTRLREAAVSDVDIARTLDSGQLPSRAVEVALGDGGEHTLRELAHAARLPESYAGELMQALGRPRASPEEHVFTDEDIELARIARQMLEAGIPDRELIAMARVLSLSMSRSAEAIRRLVAHAYLNAGDSEEKLAARYVEAADALSPLMPAMFSLTFRAHLRDGISGEVLTEAERESGRLIDSQEVGVAFADLVDYTRLGDGLPADELGAIAEDFAAIGAAVANSPVRLVKTIGDAAMFVSLDAPRLTNTLVELRGCVDAAEELPDLRIGAAFGAATPRAGDWFGTTVNVASRVADIASPGQLLATEEFVARAGGDHWTKRRKRNLKGLEGRLRLYSYERPQ
jgi:adenylate cyclase